VATTSRISGGSVNQSKSMAKAGIAAAAQAKAAGSNVAAK